MARPEVAIARSRTVPGKDEFGVLALDDGATGIGDEPIGIEWCQHCFADQQIEVSPLLVFEPERIRRSLIPEELNHAPAPGAGCHD